MTKRKRKGKFSEEVPEPTTLEGKLDAALIAFRTLSPQLQKEQTFRRRIIIVGLFLFLAMTGLVLFLYFDGKQAVEDLEEAQAQIEDFQDSICEANIANREFAIRSISTLQEALISSTNRPGDDEPEAQAEYDQAVEEFRNRVQEGIEDLPEIDCEVSSG